MIYSIMIALLVAQLFNVLIYANKKTCNVTMWTQNDVKSQKNISLKTFSA